jgi:hypothetical protein
VPLPLSADDYVALLPTELRTIQMDGIQIAYRRYDAHELHPYRLQDSTDASRGGKWTVHYNPHDPSAVWVRDPEGSGWIQCDWMNREAFARPFSESVRSSVIIAVLNADHFSDSSRQVVEQLTDGDSECLQRLFARDTADPLLAALLVHHAPSVRAVSSLAFSVGVKHGPSLPREWLESWRTAFLETSLASVNGHSKWRLQKILEALSESDPELCGEWFNRRLINDNEYIQGSLDKVEHLLRKLPSRVRKTLAIESASRRSNALLPQLIGYDAELAAALLGDGVIDVETAMDALSGNRDAGVELLAPVLLEAGATPQRIARRVYGNVSWSGPESTAIRSEIEWFRRLAGRNPKLESVSYAAIADLTNDYERALTEEKRERVRGR